MRAQGQVLLDYEQRAATLGACSTDYEQRAATLGACSTDDSGTTSNSNRGSGSKEDGHIQIIEQVVGR